MSTAMSLTPDERRMTFRAEALVHTSGRIRIEVDARPTAVLEVRAGLVQLKPDDGGGADGVIACSHEEEADVWRMLLGELNPMVALLRARYQIKENPEFVGTVLLGLQRSSEPSYQAKEV